MPGNGDRFGRELEVMREIEEILGWRPARPAPPEPAVPDEPVAADGSADPAP